MRNYSFDFFRGLAASIVCIGHFYFWNNDFSSIPSSFILAVDFFLILSGFVISQSIFKKKSFSIALFAINRWIRLFPVFILCFLTILASKFIFNIDRNLPSILDIKKYIALGHMLPFNLNSVYKDPLPIAYTISAELWVGIFIFPIIYFQTQKFKILIIVSIILYSYINIIMYSPNFMDIHYQFFNDYIYFGIIRCLLDYSLGILAFLLLNKIKISNKFLSIGQLSLLFSFAALYIPINYDRNLEYFSPLIFTFFILFLSMQKGVIYHLTNNKVGQFFGNISYPIYLIHPLFIGLFSSLKITPNVLTTCIFLILCIFSSWGIHIFYEKPMMKLIIKH